MFTIHQNQHLNASRLWNPVLFLALTISVLCLVSCDPLLNMAVDAAGGKTGQTTSTTSGTITCDGSISAPQNLVLGTTFAAHVGGYYSSTSCSYYKFTVPSDGWYSVSASGWNPSVSSWIDFCLYTSSGFSSYTQYINSTSGLGCLNLSAGTYYIKVYNDYASTSSLTYSLLVASSTSPNDGTVSSPTTVNIGTPLATRIGISSGSYTASYYTFTTGSSGGLYNIEATTPSPSATLSGTVYSNSSFSTVITSPTAFDVSSFTTVSLSPNTVYYLKVTNTSGSYNSIYKLTISGS